MMFPRVGLERGLLVAEEAGRGSWVTICAEAYFRPWKTEERLVASMVCHSGRGLDQMGCGLATPVFRVEGTECQFDATRFQNDKGEIRPSKKTGKGERKGKKKTGVLRTNPGVVQHDVQTSVRPHGSLDQLLHLLGHGHIHFDKNRLSACFGDSVVRRAAGLVFVAAGFEA